MRQPAPATGFWTPSPWFLAQVNHVLASISIVLVGALHGWRPGWIVLGIVVGAALKEFVADLTFLEHDTLAGSAQDFAFYLAGAGCAWLACVTLWPGVGLAVLIALGLTAWDISSQHLAEL